MWELPEEVREGKGNLLGWLEGERESIGFTKTDCSCLYSAKGIFSGFQRNSVYEGYVTEGMLLGGVSPVSPGCQTKETPSHVRLVAQLHSPRLGMKVLARAPVFPVRCVDLRRWFSTNHPSIVIACAVSQIGVVVNVHRGGSRKPAVFFCFVLFARPSTRR